MTTINRFRTEIGANVFFQKYAQGGNDSWDNLAIRLVDDVCGTMGNSLHPILSLSERDQLTQYIKEMKFIPGGRYLYYAGRKIHAWNNCFSGDTKVMTEEHGMVELDRIVGDTVKVLSPVDGKYYPAKIHEHGEQELNEITFTNIRGKSNIEYKIKATRNHHWLLLDGTDTYDLRVGDQLPANEFDSGELDLGFVHGFVFGDGNAKGQLRLCCAKDRKLLDKLTRVEHTLTYPQFANGDPLLYYPQKIDWKSLPEKHRSNAYISSFIKGWLAADGSETAGNKLCSVNKDALLWFRENAVYAGIVITGDLRDQVRDITLGTYEYKQHKIYIQNYSYGEAFPGFKVKSIVPIGKAKVYCPFEPVYQQIVINHNIHTFNCFLLKCEEDTREEWANILWRASSCLMLGGGIGVDYSVLRPSGRTLSRTGGVSSGPVPLMQMVNEVGRFVMQGGSRRSAIYASLNHKHEDIWDFLKVKNWDNYPVAGTNLAEIKKDHFNFPAPLDMTNISVNYDNSNLIHRSGTGSLLEFDSTNKVFQENCRQAMMTGEPGFSFNFGAKENETLRNACCEVTSEDDSDVCNLGSINIGNIETLEEFKSVVQLASKFLVCGTIRADLPYDKVRQVREKNRRLGLGLMGIHEWLLKQGSKYEVTPELHKWLQVYKDESEQSANQHCDRLYLSRPVAYRAIAPTGTLGILSGTTTGIEPLFAVAYKRRYLTEGTKWKYEYVIDHTADYLIKETGVKPENIDTAYSLSSDYERRIKFQYDIQHYVDMSISSTLNLPSWGSKHNNEDTVEHFTKVLAKYAPGLRGMTCYPDGSRGGQPITEVEYEEALKHKNVIYEDTDPCVGGVCGV